MALVVLPRVGVLIAGLSRRVRGAAAREQDAVGVLAALALEGLSALREVKSCGAELRELRRLGDHSQRAARWAARRIVARATAPLINEVLAAIALAVTLIYAGGLVQAKALAAEQVISFFTAVLLLYRPIKGIGNAVQTIAAGRASVARVSDLLADPLEQLDDRPELPPLRGRLELRQVHYCYPDGRLALAGVDLAVGVGRMIVVAGPSGAGKSTLGNLLAGLDRPTAGRMLWDGEDLAEVSLPALRRQVALVPQLPLLFDGTIAANLRFAAPLADDSELCRALRAAGLRRWLSELPGGLATPLGPSGQALSTGQAQRLAIARALLRPARLLVLDEPSSALDAESEQQLVRTLRTLARDRAIVVLSHSRALIAAADEVLWLEGAGLGPRVPDGRRRGWPAPRPESQSIVDGG
jgi:subfamily B ATP-binding cassette protein MsbA